jgi:phosphatidylglycerophosphatase A
MLKCKEFLNELIVTGLFVGKIKYAPGTFGSLLAFPITVLMVLCGVYIIGGDYGVFIAQITAILLLFIVGTIASNNYIKRTGRQDPKEIVIDEIAGQMLTILLCTPSLIFINEGAIDMHNITAIVCLFIMPFALFRLFDIKKPWPINWMDQNIHGGLGVMLDDLMAALFASVMHYVLIFLWIDFVK